MYALGVLLHRMVTGRLPFNPPDLVGKHLSANPPSPSSVHPGLPEAYDEVVLRCLAKRPEDRYSSLADLRRAVMELPVGPEVDDPAQPGPVSSQEGDRERRGSGQRYRMHGPLAGEAGSVQLIHAEDLHLGREVQLVRAPPGPERERVMTLVQAAAAVPPEGGRQHLQVVLDLDEERGWAVLVPTPPPRLPAPESRRERLELCHQIALALAPLHRAGASHGEVAKEGSIAMAGGQFILLLGPALVAQGVSPPGQDLQDLALLCGLEDLPHDVDSDVLGGWAAEQLSVLMDMELQEQRERLLRQAAASAEEF